MVTPLLFMPETEKSNLTAQVLSVLATPDLPALGPEMRKGVKPAKTITSDVNALIKGEDSITQAKVRSAALLWHDHLDESHTISQDLHDRDGSFLHGIMHRREPDYGNAKYWFHRVGAHACFPEIAREAGTLLDGKRETELKNQLCPHGEWDAFAFVDACEQANRRDANPARKQLLQEIQRIEFETLLEHICRPD